MEHLEIERKFLVKNSDYRDTAHSQKRIIQGFLNCDPQRTIRVRIIGNKGFLTIKGESNSSGTTRYEWEREIPLDEAANLIDLCEGVILEKIRFEVSVKGHFFEVDEFMAENKGLIIAEVELEHEDEPFQKPHWLGNEVTGQIKYYNSQLSKNPFKNW
ncbi:MAG: CYTH domain-containing protein [Croceitalea sp.]|nr:CYTH domain-containing protein [Croceitalea sp.]MBT8238543.1 CYTH domain-containing protein [Croceitalea sp.]NNC35379.1 CYTH domain-containing protein [Croceitalea sp.]NNL08177.1 CYTH domain-containing protein [Croceitalea sp.]NNM17008.1 CYTH domain-containing protein [Croceitalea sp.]